RIERWSRGTSFLHGRHAAAKILAALTLLVCIATLTPHTMYCCAAYLLILAGAVAMAKLPVARVLLGAAAVLPFALCFAAVSVVSGQPDRAAMLLVRGYLSSLTALLLIATTPMPDLLAGLESLRAPRFLLQVMQFLYRYLIVLIEEASAMRDAAASRAGTVRALALRQAAGAAGVLFVRSYGRAEAIHRAMMARGFEGHIPVFRSIPFRAADGAFAIFAAALAIGFRAVSP
ncbi:MAG: energy-coupling factor transporter transmembrane component T, partial [Acidobacteriota bacterium]